MCLCKIRFWMNCWLYGLYFDDVRIQVLWLPAPCVLNIYIYIYIKIYYCFGLRKPGCYRTFRRLFSLASLCTCYSTRTSSGRAKQPTKPEYRLKMSIILDLIVGSSLNFYRSFWRLFSLAKHWNRYETSMASDRARQPTGLEYQLKMSITFDSIVGSCSDFCRSFQRLFS